MSTSTTNGNNGNSLTIMNSNNTVAYPIHKGQQAANLSILNDPITNAKPAVWTITQDFRKPERTSLSINLPMEAQGNLAEVSETYRGLLLTVIENAAKTILKRYVEAFSIYPSSIPAALLDADSIMSEAVGNNSEWLSKDDLTQAWEASATRQKFISDPRYAGAGVSKEYRAAVNAYADLILKLAGKTSTYQPEELDAMLAKMLPADLDTQLGSFVCRRVDALRNKKQAPALNLDLL